MQEAIHENSKLVDGSDAHYSHVLCVWVSLHEADTLVDKLGQLEALWQHRRWQMRRQVWQWRAAPEGEEMHVQALGSASWLKRQTAEGWEDAAVESAYHADRGDHASSCRQAA